MPAKAVKTFQRNPKMRKHRSHRSKKGARPKNKPWKKDFRDGAADHRRQVEEMRLQELDRDI
jgi:hypothetical protein